MRSFGKALVALGTVLATATTSSTAAEAAPGGESGWVPYRTPAFDLAAGVSCSFELKGDIVYDHELTRVDATFPDGSPEVQEWLGPLGVRFTNVATGESVVRDASGTLTATFHEGGGADELFTGNGIAPIFSGNPIYPAGIYLVSGYVVYTVHPDGSRELSVQRGTIENMCETLA
jgi:hypothetical protein